MTSALLYIFFFSTWGLGLLTWTTLILIRISEFNQSTERHKFKLQNAKVKMAENMVNSLRDRLSGGTMSPLGRGMSSRLQDLVRTANQNHPEVNEIDPSDLIIGVKFEGSDYPPEMDDEEEGDD